jgi:gliding motility-associated-like protein
VSVIITQPSAALGGSISSQANVTCFGSNSGGVSITASGGTSPYKYKLGSGSFQVSGTFGNLPAGAYLITIEDANSCTFSIPVIITQPLTALTGSITTQVNASCSGSANGSVTVIGAGGVMPYMYSLNGGTYQSSGSFSGLAAATYTITVRDANLCPATVSATITEPEAISIADIKDDILCPGDADGKITLTITGGIQPFKVLWLDDDTTTMRQNLTAGTYSVVVTDKNGCAASHEVVIVVLGSEKCIEIPEIITPNTDGFNDTWQIKNIDLFPQAEIFVYNRWGKLVFNTRNIAANPWNGTFKGQLLPTDSYHYILHLNDGSDPKSGVISIIR